MGVSGHLTPAPHRLLLDWTCTATTLTLMDWFKLEDIAVSLYFVACEHLFTVLAPLRAAPIVIPKLCICLLASP